MKEKFFLLTLAIMSMLSYGQDNQLVWANGHLLYGTPIDSLTYDKMEDLEIIHILLPRIVEKTIHDTVTIVTYDTIETIIYDTIYVNKHVRKPEGALPGEFYVSPTKKISFAKGNLQYLASAGVWRFAENQYDFIGSKNNNASKSYNGWIDVFGYGTSGWSGSGASYYQPWNAHYSNDDLSGYLNHNLSGSYDNADWGVFNQISNGGNTTNMWRTLSQKEWEYLITNHDWTIVQVAGILGLMVLPDNFKNPLTISINYPSYRSGLHDSDKNYSLSFSSMTKLTIEQFEMLQNAGVVFLPCGGYRYSIGMMDIDTFGNYWTSTAGKNIWFTQAVLYCVSGAERWAGLQVRLATDIE